MKSDLQAFAPILEELIMKKRCIFMLDILEIGRPLERNRTEVWSKVCLLKSIRESVDYVGMAPTRNICNT